MADYMMKFVKIAAVAVAVLCGPLAVLLMGQTQSGLFLPNQFCGGTATSPVGTPTAALCIIRNLLGPDLPNPATGSLGGVAGFTPVTHEWINGIQADGTPSATRPAVGDLAAVAADTYLGNASGSPSAPGAVSWVNCTGANSALTYSTGAHTLGCNALAGATTIVVPQGRLTLTANTPVMVASATAQTTLRYDCYQGGGVPYYTGAIDTLDAIASCEVTSAMANSGAGVLNSAGVFDVWWEGNTNHNICVATNGSGGGWASDTAGSNVARGTGYTQLDRTTRPYITNKNAIAHCYNGATDYGSVTANKLTYLGTIYTSGAGQVSYAFGAAASGGTAGLLGVWNAYNRVMVTTTVTDNGTAYTYTSGTVREARGSALYQVSFVTGIQEDGVQFSRIGGMNILNVVSAFGRVGVGFDSTTAFGVEASSGANVTAAVGINYVLSNSGVWNVGPGLHVLSANEEGDNANANTFDPNSTDALMFALRM